MRARPPDRFGHTARPLPGASPALLRPLESLTLLAGAFNFVVADTDRWNKLTGDFSGHADRAEAAQWRRVLPATTFYELLQENPTRAGPQTLGRLDRVYTNQAVVEQLDRHVFATVLPLTQLSQHRPVTFGRATRRFLAAYDR